MIYLDNAATSLWKPEQVAFQIMQALQTLGNPGRGAHEPTLAAARMVYDTRVRMAELFGISNPEQIAFTQNATMALNIAISGLFEPGDHVISTVLEHNSVLRPLYRLEEQGVAVSWIGTTGQAERDLQMGGIDPSEKSRPAGGATKRESGILDYEALEQAVTPRTKAVIVTHASNVSGNITDLARISAIAKARKLFLIVDASQTAGALPIHVEQMGIDVLCFTGHKSLLGPQGTGGIYIRKGLQMRPFLVGGSGVHSYDRHHPLQMPTALEAGTLNVHGIAGLNGALQYLQQVGVEQIRDIEQARVRQFVEGASVIRGITLYGDPDLSRRCGIVSLNIGDEDSGWVCDALWEEGEIAVRGGAHCAPRMHEALGTKEQGCVRFSVSGQTTKEEIDETLRVLERIAKECQ